LEDEVASENCGMRQWRKKENVTRVEIKYKPTPLNALMGCDLFAPKRMFPNSLNTCDKMQRNKAVKPF
jgi:hypothetical protein